HRPAHCSVANAVGATLGKVSGECERLHHPRTESREEAIAEAGATARQNALAGGAASENLEIASIDEIPLPYMPEETVRLRVRAVGDLAI
ncbi:MAG: hydantoinase/oxoprolinase family protein, partial [Rhodospirillaceae bacterium]|nr:hydantoinase/oxoprolinase family protein [Rhodospirillaceae bacterium]